MNTATKEFEKVEVTVVCEQCFRVTVKEMYPDDAKRAKFVQCQFCGQWVKN